MKRALIGLLVTLVFSSQALADSEQSGAQALRDAQSLFRSGQYFKAARYAFDANEQDPSLQSEAYSWITLGLCNAGLYQSASYFFIRTLQSGNKSAIRRVLGETENLLVRVGGDLLRNYLIRHTKYEDYDPVNRSAYLYALAKDALLSDAPERAIGYVNGISSQSPLWPYALQIRGAANAILDRGEDAIRDFRNCEERAQDVRGAFSSEDRARISQANREAQDLESRCIAGRARTLYQMNRFEEADRTFDKITKNSLVWPDILFEQAWNSFGKQEYNRSLGKLVSYKSPALKFVFNSEVDVLRAQSYLALCLYNDANGVINDFNSKYLRVGEEVKSFVEENSSNANAFYELGKRFLRDPLYTNDDFHRLVNRFIRGPYFQDLVISEHEVSNEQYAIRQFDRMQPGVAHHNGAGFPGFLQQVLGWRLRSIQLLGGSYVKNSLMDYHSELLSDFDKMAFIKLEMLKRAKDSLLYKNPPTTDRARGNVEPSRRSDQYYWSFNGEFWNDELGDYVFGLESECRK